MTSLLLPPPPTCSHTECPLEVDNYHSLCNLEPINLNAGSVFGYPGVVYKSFSLADQLPYCMRRVRHPNPHCATPCPHLFVSTASWGDVFLCGRGAKPFVSNYSKISVYRLSGSGYRTTKPCPVSRHGRRSSTSTLLTCAKSSPHGTSRTTHWSLYTTTTHSEKPSSHATSPKGRALSPNLSCGTVPSWRDRSS